MTVSILRPCPGVPGGWWKCPGFLLFVKNTQKFAKPCVAGVKPFFFRDDQENHWSEDLFLFFFWRSPKNSRKKYDCPGSLSEKYGTPILKLTIKQKNLINTFVMCVKVTMKQKYSAVHSGSIST